MISKIKQKICCIGGKMSNKLTLYNLDVSPPCRAVRIIAKLLNVEFEIRNIDLSKGEQLQESFIKVCFHSVKLTKTVFKKLFIIFFSIISSIRSILFRPLSMETTSSGIVTLLSRTSLKSLQLTINCIRKM